MAQLQREGQHHRPVHRVQHEHKRHPPEVPAVRRQLQRHHHGRAHPRAHGPAEALDHRDELRRRPRGQRHHRPASRRGGTTDPNKQPARDRPVLLAAVRVPGQVPDVLRVPVGQLQAEGTPAGGDQVTALERHTKSVPACDLQLHVQHNGEAEREPGHKPQQPHAQAAPAP